MAYCYDRRNIVALDADAKNALEVPADLSKRGLVAWISLLRLKALGYPPGSSERKQFLEEAVKKLAYAEFILRGSRSLVSFLRDQARRLSQLVDTVSE